MTKTKQEREVRQLLSQTLTVGKIREALEGYDDDTPVVFVTEYGDFPSTMQALAVSIVDTYRRMKAWMPL